MTKIGSIPSTRRLHDIVFVKMDETEFLLTGTEEGKLLLYRLDFSPESIEKGTACHLLGTLAGHSNRYAHALLCYVSAIHRNLLLRQQNQGNIAYEDGTG